MLIADSETDLLLQQQAEQRAAIAEPALGLWDVDDETYHAYHGAVSNSMLKKFAESIPLYSALFVEHTMAKAESTEAMKVGKSLHLMISDGGAYGELVRVGPAGDKRTKEVKAAWTDFELQCAGTPGVIIVTEAQSRMCDGMYAALAGHTELAELLWPDHDVLSEQALIWEHPASGVRCKALFDFADTSCHTIIDIKTCEDPSPEGFQRAAVSLGYDRQQAFYSMAYESMYGEVPRFLFAVVGKNAPHEAVLYEMTKSFVERGKYLVERDLDELALCMRDGQWGGRYSKGVQPLGSPKWAQVGGSLE